MRVLAVGIVAALTTASFAAEKAAAQAVDKPTAAAVAGAGSGTGDVSASPVIGSGANGNGGVMTGTTGTSPAIDGSSLGAAKPTAGQLDGVASGKAAP